MSIKEEGKGSKRRGHLVRRLRLAASRDLRFFSSCLFSKNLLRLHSWITPAFITSRRNLLSSLSSGSLSSTTTCTLYADRKNSVFACARDGHITDDKSGAVVEEGEDEELSCWATRETELALSFWREREEGGTGTVR